MAKLLHQGQDFSLNTPIEQRIFVLHRGDRLHRVCAANGLNTRFRKPPMLDLAFGDQAPDGTGHVFDRHVRVDPMLVKNVDAVGFQTLEARLCDAFDVLGLAVGAAVARTGLKIDVKAELGGDDDLVANWRERLADEFLVGERAVGFRRVKQAHAAIVGGADQLDHLGLVGGWPVGGAHAHASEAEGGNLQAPKCSGFHKGLPCHCCVALRLSSFPALRRRKMPTRRRAAALPGSGLPPPRH